MAQVPDHTIVNLSPFQKMPPGYFLCKAGQRDFFWLTLGNKMGQRFFDRWMAYNSAWGHYTASNKERLFHMGVYLELIETAQDYADTVAYICEKSGPKLSQQHRELIYFLLTHMTRQ